MHKNKEINTYLLLFSLQLKLTWNNVNLETRIASLYDTKNRDDKHIPLTKTIIELLSNLTQSSEFIYRISANCFRLAWKKCRNKSNIKGLKFYNLIYDAVSRFFEMG